MRQPRRLDEQGLFDYAVRALGARAHSAGELRQKLLRRAETASQVDAVIARLRDSKYLNDRQFAESFASSRLTNQQFGARRVLRDLRQRRVTAAIADHSVQKVYASVDESRLVEDYIRRRFRSAPLDGKQMAQAYRRLLRAGFSTGHILTALKKFAKNPELLDGFEPPAEEEEDE